MTEMLFRSDPYQREAKGKVLGHTDEGGIILDQTVFYPTGGGQPGDSGVLTWNNGQSLEIATTIKGEGDQIVLVPAAPNPMPPIGTHLDQKLDWERRYRHMRIHTALHLLSVVIPLPVTGGAVGAEKGRLDFNMPEPLENRDALEEGINGLIDRDLPIRETWITDEELDASPGLVKTLRVQPPRGSGRIRLVAIGEGKDMIDLQPCGGTHVARTSEIGRVHFGKVEKKGKTNRRVNLLLEA
ncbi:MULTISPECIES: alanyl-tRNA editing protein [Halocynthiibacter]|uniref:Alanine--tRNA ligase n=1 Tax=Halocynthiibacter halioticoli TaxID=2986804 RepID=A0AAE3J1T3_9RHOB|nr:MULTISPECIES: alanyl-tRNA editing protein [Halocynthiibacter]MCV6824566.1 alanyl-tRNA editing protein [Halocynthiibacter halioticoli]MCW4057567.1 alanyl-tRNA editing protein [Halocynthiibacter sp. SDUM655004]